MYPIGPGVGRRRGTLAPGTPVPPRAGTVLPYSDRPSRFPRGVAPAPRGGGGAGSSKLTPAPRRREACSLGGHLGHWVWECRAQSPEVRAHERALHEAVVAHWNWRGPAPPPPLPLGSGPPVAPSPPAVAATGSAPPSAAFFVHAVDAEDRAYPDAEADNGGSFSEEWPRWTVTSRASTSPREMRKGQPPEWAAHGRCPPQSAPAQLHHGEPPASVPQAAGRGGFPSGARLLLPGPGATRGVCRASSGGLNPALGQPLPAYARAPSPIPPVAASVLALGHSARRPWCGGDAIPAYAPANEARIGGGGRRRLGGRARRQRTSFRCHTAAVVASAGPPGTLPGEGDELLFSLHDYRIVASLGLDEPSIVAFGVLVDTGDGPNLVRRSALAPAWLR